MQPLLLPLPCLVCSRGVLPVMPQDEEVYLLLLLPSLHVVPAIVMLRDNLFSSTASSPASLVFHLPGASVQPPSLLLPYPIYRRGELTILPQDEEFTCCYFYRPLLLSLYLLCNIIYLGCDFACDIYTKV